MHAVSRGIVYTDTLPCSASIDKSILAHCRLQLNHHAHQIIIIITIIINNIIKKFIIINIIMKLIIITTIIWTQSNWIIINATIPSS